MGKKTGEDLLDDLITLSNQMQKMDEDELNKVEVILYFEERPNHIRHIIGIHKVSFLNHVVLKSTKEIKWEYLKVTRSTRYKIWLIWQVVKGKFTNNQNQR